jgi:hypothetical protein
MLLPLLGSVAAGHRTIIFLSMVFWLNFIHAHNCLLLQSSILVVLGRRYINLTLRAFASEELKRLLKKTAPNLFFVIILVALQ